MGLADDLLVLAGACAMLDWAVRPRMGRARRVFTLWVVGFLAAIALANTWTVLWLAGSGQIQMHWPIPASAFVTGVLARMWQEMSRPQIPTRKSELTRLAIGTCGLGAVAIAFPLLQMGAFGKTDYRRSVQAIVVFGARTYADGSLSLALADRVRTACHLYSSGYGD